MSTTAFNQPQNYSKYFLNPPTGPSPPESYPKGQSGPASSPMAQQPPPWNEYLQGQQGSAPSRMPRESYAVNVNQVRPRRQPMYLPAALRPTEPVGRNIPHRPRPLDTPPQSHGNSFDSNNSDMQALEGVSLPFDNGEEARIQLDRELTNLALGEGLEDNPEPVTGPPTTAHWKPDVVSKACAICHIPFTWYFRRHHCRHCGEVVCDNHIKGKVPLDQNARFHVHGEESKACPRCTERWKAIKQQRDSRANSIAEFEIDNPDSSVAAVAIPKQRPGLSEEQRATSVAHSYGHHFSTF